MSILAEWDSFCVIVGSSAGALIGLQFVVMTLMAERQIRSPDAGAAFGSPTVVHFSVVLFLAVTYIIDRDAASDFVHDVWRLIRP